MATTVTRNRRILGHKLSLTIDGVDYWSDIAEYELSPDEKDDDALTFADAATGSTSAWKLKLKAVQSTDPSSLWTKVWNASGKTVDFTLAPHGNLTPTDTEPHFTGAVRITRQPGIGTSAGEDKGATFEVEWDLDGGPLMVTRPTGETITPDPGSETPGA